MDVVLVDDYDRLTLGTVAPNGQTYINAGPWDIYTGATRNYIRPDGVGGGTFAYNTFHADAKVTVEFGEDEYNEDGLILRATPDFDIYARLVLWQSAPGGAAILIYNPAYPSTPDDTAGIRSLGQWTGLTLDPGDIWAVEMDGPDYTVSQNGIVLGTLTDPDDNALDQTIHGLHQFGLSDGFQCTMASLTVEYNQATRIRLTPEVGHPDAVAETPAIEATTADTWVGFYEPFETLGANAPNGQPWEGTSNWTVSGGQLATTLSAEHFLVTDTQSTTLDMRIVLVDDSVENQGITFRWTDVNNWVGVSINNQPGPVPADTYIFSRTGGSYTVVAHWLTALAPAPGKEVRVLVEGDDITVWYDGAEIGTASTSTHAGITKAGLWLYGSGHIEELRWDPTPTTPQPTLAPGLLNVHGGDLASPAIAPEVVGGHLTLHGGSLYPPGVAYVEPGHAALHGGSMHALRLLLDQAHLTLHTATLSAVLVPGHGGSAAYPIGEQPAGPGTGLLDEDGNLIVDEDGDVLVFD